MQKVRIRAKSAIFSVLCNVYFPRTKRTKIMRFFLAKSATFVKFLYSKRDKFTSKFTWFAKHRVRCWNFERLQIYRKMEKAKRFAVRFCLKNKQI